MDPKKIDRINELAKKKKTEGLTPEEKVEQANVKKVYMAVVSMIQIHNKYSFF